MIKIAHRGNTSGPSENENNPDYLVMAIVKGFDVEADIWITDSGIFLGHDAPAYSIDESFLESIAHKAWFHCKNVEALKYFIDKMPNARYFWHQEDDYALTSNCYIWTYPGKTVTNRSIVVLKEPSDLELYTGAYGVCTSYLI